MQIDYEPPTVLLVGPEWVHPEFSVGIERGIESASRTKPSNWDLRQDIRQTILLKFMHKALPLTNVFGFGFTVGRRQTINFHKRARRQGRALSEKIPLIDPSPSVLSQLCWAELFSALNMHLSSQEMTVLELRIDRQMSDLAISHHLCISRYELGKCLSAIEDKLTVLRERFRDT